MSRAQPAPLLSVQGLTVDLKERHGSVRALDGITFD
ncbi:MAG: hypothetical protein JWQ33_2377, partial [Ramlibacter sp.]|nr:hypothetical protein [Ramlibacter sp.]